MLHLALVYLHLLATCLAIGLLMACDLRLLARLREPGTPAVTVLRPPSRFVVRAVAGALLVLIATGAGLVVLALQERPDALANPKLQAKLLLVAVLVGNAVALHRLVFPRLGRGATARRASAETGVVRWVALAAVALPLAVSHALWAYCALLGIARPWNFVQPIEALLGGGLAAVALAWIGAVAVLARVTGIRSGLARSRGLPVAVRAGRARQA